MKDVIANRPCSILVVDDDADLASTLQEFLQQEGYAAEVALSASEALALQEGSPNFSLALVDLMMPLTGGLELMDQLHRMDPDLPVVIMTGFGTIETAVEAIKRGAEDYLTKPFDPEAVRKKIGRLTEVFRLRERVQQLEASLDRCPCFENIICVSVQMQRVLERARAAAASDVPVLLVGETGTGKEMLAYAVHASSRRGHRPFVPINCGALPRELVESEMFGFRRGAFTGAVMDSPGIFVSASGGTVFLDEVGEMAKDIQVKLLRVLQEGELRPVGCPKPVQVDVRIVAASNRPLAELRAECLRGDFYYRLATVVIEVPPLRSRPDDIMVLAQHFTARLARRYDRKITLAPSALELLLGYPFPGNVRQLENLLESIVALCDDKSQTITRKDVRALLSAKDVLSSPATLPNQPLARCPIR